MSFTYIIFLTACDVITFYSPEAVMMTAEDFAPQRGAMHQSIVTYVCL
jgi:hypothetical protein